MVITTSKLSDLHFHQQGCMSRHRTPISHSSSWVSAAVVFVAAVTYLPPLAASLLSDSVSCIVGCNPPKSSSFPTAITAAVGCGRCISWRLPLTSVRSTIFHSRLAESSARNTCWQCKGNANESECTLLTMWLKFANVKPYRVRSMLGNRASRVGLTHSHNNIVVQWFR